MDDEVPDYFEDPMDEIVDFSHEKFKDLLKEYNEIHTEASVWGGFVTGSYLDASNNSEENVPEYNEMLLGEIIKSNFLLMKIVKLLSEKGKGAS